MTPQARAEKCADLMFAQDAASPGLGMKIMAVSPGGATLEMRVRDDMLNGNGLCLGGYIFALANSAFAFACNSYNQLVVAQQNQITYVNPAQKGELLRAAATEVARSGRSGTYDVSVTGTDGRQIALFRGLSRQGKGTHFEEASTESPTP